MKLNQILFPVDFSDSSRALNPQVEWLANRYNSDVTLMHVFEIPFTWYGSGDAPMLDAACWQNYMESIRQRLKEYPLNLPAGRVHRVLAEGDAAWQIKNWVSEHNVDLVAIGTHGYGAVRRLLLGSVAMKVLHDVNCPVWTHSMAGNHKNIEKIRNIVCSVELSEETVGLLQFVRDLAQEFGANVRLLHSVPEDGSTPYRLFDTDLHRFLVKVAGEEIARVQEYAGTSFPVDLVDLPIGHATATAAAQQNADLVVIGRGRAKALLGSLRTHTYDIIRESGCPVLSYCQAEVHNGQQSTKSSTEHKEVLSAQ